MIMVKQSDCGRFEFDISGDELDQLVDIALCTKRDPDDLLKLFVAGGIRMNYSELFMKGHIDEHGNRNT